MTILILGSNVTSESLCKMYSPCPFGRDWKGWSEGKRHDLFRMLWGIPQQLPGSPRWFYLERTSPTVVLLRTPPLASRMPQGWESLLKLLCLRKPWSPTHRDTTSAKVPRAHLVSGSGNLLPHLSVLTLGVLDGRYEWDFLSHALCLVWSRFHFLEYDLERKFA